MQSSALNGVLLQSATSEKLTETIKLIRKTSAALQNQQLLFGQAIRSKVPGTQTPHVAQTINNTALSSLVFVNQERKAKFDGALRAMLEAQEQKRIEARTCRDMLESLRAGPPSNIELSQNLTGQRST